MPASQPPKGIQATPLPTRSVTSAFILARNGAPYPYPAAVLDAAIGGEETRTNPWLAELQQDMFIEISPADAADRGIKDGGWVWVTGAENNSRARMKALVTERVGKGVAWMPFHFGGWLAGKDLRGTYPKGTDPIVLGESANTITTYGYDPATGMQEPKVTLCQIAAA